MKPPPFEYHRPHDLPAAIALLARLDNAKLLAGGQSLMAMLNLRFIFPDHLVDLNRVPELSGIGVHPDHVRIGAMTRQRALEIDPDMAAAMPILAEALHQVGHRQTRNRGTVGGSLSHLDPAAELPALALLHDGVVEIAGPAGARSLPVAAFMADYMTPAIEADEIVTALVLPRWSAAHGHSFQEVSRRHGDFAIASAGTLLEVAGGVITRAAIVVGGVDVVPRRLPAAEAALCGQPGTAASFAAAADHAKSLACTGDIHFTPGHRRHVAATLVRRTLAQAYDRTRAR